MRYLVDTNALSDHRRGRSAALDAWFARQSEELVAISALTVLEIERGARRAARRDRLAASHLHDWLENSVLNVFDGRILPVDEAVARLAAPLHVPDPMPEFDALIAATAIRHDLTLVTRNVRDMARTGVRILSPWEDDA